MKTAVDDSEDMSMDFIYQAMDCYKKAIILTREVEVSRIFRFLSDYFYLISLLDLFINSGFKGL